MGKLKPKPLILL